MSGPFITTSDEYNSVVSTGKCVVFFTLATCGPCQRIKPVFFQLQNTYSSLGIAFILLDITRNPNLQDMASKMNIKSFPTFIFYRNGQIISSFISADQNQLNLHVQQLANYEFKH
jgi:thioredoxin 1